MKPLKCDRCGFIVMSCELDPTWPCPICQGQFLPLEESGEGQSAKDLKIVQGLKKLISGY